MEVTRRAFLKGAGIVGAGAALAAATGCANASTNASTIKEADGTVESLDFMTPPEPIAEDQIPETTDVDIVVVGGGMGGLSAALAAIDNGASVALLEKHRVPRFGGADIAAFGSKVQRELGIEYDIDAMVRRYYKHVDMDCNQALVSAWAHNSGRIVDRLLEIGEPEGIGAQIRIWPYREGWDPAEELCEIWPTAHSFGPKDEFFDNAGAWTSVFVQYLTDNGVDFRYSTPAVQLVQEDHGTVTGVIAQTSDGAYIRFNASRGVVLATGDFGGNPEMMSSYFGPEICDLCSSANAYTSKMDAQDLPKEPLNVGDGHKMALWAGGQMEEPPYSAMMVATWGLGSPFMHVNLNGERFHNEDSQEGLWPLDILQQPNGAAFVVYDSKWEEDAKRLNMWGMWGANPANGSNAEYSGETIAELAKAMGVPADALRETVDKRNEYASTGVDLDFAMTSEHITTISEPPFYASHIGTYFSVETAGVKVSANSEVLDAERKPIPGLYAAGNVVGERFGIAYAPFFCGMSNGMAVTTGYLGVCHALGLLA